MAGVVRRISADGPWGGIGLEQEAQERVAVLRHEGGAGLCNRARALLADLQRFAQWVEQALPTM